MTPKSLDALTAAMLTSMTAHDAVRWPVIADICGEKGGACSCPRTMTGADACDVVHTAGAV